MTENQWPQDRSYGTPTATQRRQDCREPASLPVQTANQPTTAPENCAWETPGGTASKTDTAKDEAGEVTRQAADSAQNVAETAKSEAANVAAEVKTNAKDLLYQAQIRPH